MLEDLRVIHADPVFGDRAGSQIENSSVLVNAIEADRAKPRFVNVTVEFCLYDAKHVIPNSRFLSDLFQFYPIGSATLKRISFMQDFE